MNRRILRIVLVLASSVFLTAVIAPAETPETAIDVDEEPSIGLPAEEEPQDLELEETEKKVIREDIVRIGEDIDVDEDERVTGDIVCIGGNLRIAGTVEGDAVCVGGTITLDSTAVVNGDAVAVGENSRAMISRRSRVNRSPWQSGHSPSGFLL
jgi:hypothetical protein